LKMAAVCSSEMFVPAYKTTWCNNLDYMYLVLVKAKRQILQHSPSDQYLCHVRDTSECIL
jgi:hypothetical protein